MLDQDILEKLKKTLSKQPVRLAYLYGSYARGQENAKSDIDIAVVMEKNCKKTDYEISKEIHSIMKNNVSKINVIEINEETNLRLLHSILKTRIVLVSKNEKERVSFEVKTTKIYWDEEYRRKMFHDYYQKKVLKGNSYPIGTMIQ